MPNKSETFGMDYAKFFPSGLTSLCSPAALTCSLVSENIYLEYTLKNLFEPCFKT